MGAKETKVLETYKGKVVFPKKKKINTVLISAIQQ